MKRIIIGAMVASMLISLSACGKLNSKNQEQIETNIEISEREPDEIAETLEESEEAILTDQERDEKAKAKFMEFFGEADSMTGNQFVWMYLDEVEIEGVLYDTSQAVYTSDYNPVASHSATFDVDNGTSKGTIMADAGTPYSLLQAGDVIVVTGTADNDGTYIIDSVANGNVITTTAVITGADGVEATTVISAPAVDPANDILSSVNGKKAVTGITRANFRLIAAKRGTGWRMTDFYLASAVQLLYLTEYASFYSQSMIGNGLTDWASATWNTYNAYHSINNSGLSNSNGNTTANTSGGNGVVGSYMSYRGIENWYGHIWEFIDGFNINDNIPYVHNTDTQFADDTAANYTDLGLVLHNANGYPATISQIGTGFLAESVGASSTTKLTDYYYQAAGWCVALFGGDADHGVTAGGFYGSFGSTSSHLAAHLGGRLCY